CVLAFACLSANAATVATKKPPAKSKKKNYRSSAGKPDPTKKAPVKAAVHAVRKRVIPKAPPVAAKVRAAAHDGVFTNIANGADIPVENASALVPFFELLYRHQKGDMPGPVRILHYGDSHTAADEWTGDLRSRFQEKFGDGGSGYSLAGRPW